MARILFDAYWWNSGPPSGRNVVRSIIGAWSETFPADELTLAVRRDDAADVHAQLVAAGIDATLQLVPRWARYHAFAARSLGRSSTGFDAVITQNFATRTAQARSATLVHDALFVEHPEWFSIPERAYLSMLRPMLKDASVIATTSRTETARIARLWPETADRLARIGLSVPGDFARSSERIPDGMDDGPFLLAVGRLNIRKNLRRMIRAVIADPALAAYRILIVGEPDGRAEDLDIASDQRSRVRFLGHVGDPELRWLYRHSSVFVFPALDEGFGLPPIEARSSGARIAVSDIPVFRELDVADAWFDPRSELDIAAAIRRALAAERTVAAPTDSWSDVVHRLRSAILVDDTGTAPLTAVPEAIAE